MSSSGLLYTPPTPHRHSKYKSMDPDAQSKLPTPPPSLEWHNRIPDADPSNNPFLSRTETNGHIVSTSRNTLPQNFFDNDNPFWDDSEHTPRPPADPAMKDTITYVFRGKKITYDTHGEGSLGNGPRLLWPAAETSHLRGRKRPAPSDSEEITSAEEEDPAFNSNIISNAAQIASRPRAIPQPESIIHRPQVAISALARSPPLRHVSSSPPSSENDMPESHPNIASAAPTVIPARIPPSSNTPRHTTKQPKTHLNEVTLRASVAKRNKLISALDDGFSNSLANSVQSSGGSFTKGFR